MKKNHLIKILLLVVLNLTINSCNEQGNEYPELSDQQLEDFLLSNQDFQDYMEFHQNRVSQIESGIDHLNENELIFLKDLYSKYNSYNELLETGSQLEKAFAENIVLVNEGNILFNKILNSLNRYKYNEESFIAIISENMVIENNNRLRLKDKCDDIYLEVYVGQLNSLYYEEGFSLEQADRAASIAASWAFVGCVKALY